MEAPEALRPQTPDEIIGDAERELGTLSGTTLDSGTYSLLREIFALSQHRDNAVMTIIRLTGLARQQQGRIAELEAQLNTRTIDEVVTDIAKAKRA